MSILHLTKTTFESEVIKSDKPVLIDFYADWCGPCKMLSPIVEKIAAMRTDIKVCKINIDEEQELASDFGVMSIPTLVVVKNGQVVNKSVGYCSEAKITELLK